MSVPADACLSPPTSPSSRQDDAEVVRRHCEDATGKVAPENCSQVRGGIFIMKRAIIGSLALSLAAGVVYAQNATPPATSPGQGRPEERRVGKGCRRTTGTNRSQERRGLKE